VAARAVAPCGKTSPVISATTKTSALQYTVLHGCFIATAAWGSPLDARVVALRALRDRRLLGNAAGRVVVSLYHAFSPPLAAAIAPDPSLRALARSAITPLVRLAEQLK